MNEHNQSPDFTIDFNVNVRFPGLTAIFVPALAAIFQPQLNRIEGKLMSLADQITALETSNAALVAKVEESNGKQDALILASSQTKDELVALQADVDPGLSARIQTIIDNQAAAIGSITTQEGETDAATSANGPT